MDATSEELGNITSVDGALEWVGLPKEVGEHLLELLGAPTQFRDVVFVVRTTWDTIVRRVRGKGPEAEDGSSPKSRDLTPTEMSRIEVFRRLCFQKVGAEPDTPREVVADGAEAETTLKEESQLGIRTSTSGVIPPGRLETVPGVPTFPKSDPRLATEGEALGSQGKPKKRKVKEADEQTRHDGRVYTHNKRGREICRQWNVGPCTGSTKPQSYCEHSLSHQCNRCLGPHQATCCPSPVPPSEGALARAQSQEARGHGWDGGKGARSRSPLRRRKVADQAMGTFSQASSVDRSNLQTTSSHHPADARVVEDERAGPKRAVGFPGLIYGHWSRDLEARKDQPRCLHLYSGPAREGDLSDQLGELGWATCSCDKKQPTQTDLRDETVKLQILADIEAGVFDHVLLGTPGDTFADYFGCEPSRPRPLRSVHEIEGLRRGLTHEEQVDLEEANAHAEFSAEVMQRAMANEVGFTFENPEPREPISIFKLPKFIVLLNQSGVEISDMDQCCFGSEAVKPTRLMHYGVRHATMHDRRCTHQERSFVDDSGRKYVAVHERGARRKKSISHTARSSEVLGMYSSGFARALAEDIWFTATSSSGRVEQARVGYRETSSAPESHGAGTGSGQGKEGEVNKPECWNYWCGTSEPLQESVSVGSYVRELLDQALQVHPKLLNTAANVITKSQVASEKQVVEVEKVIKTVVYDFLKPSQPQNRPVWSESSKVGCALNAQLIWDWGVTAEDPAACNLARWIHRVFEPVEEGDVRPKPADLEVAEAMRPALPYGRFDTAQTAWLEEAWLAEWGSRAHEETSALSTPIGAATTFAKALSTKGLHFLMRFPMQQVCVGEVVSSTTWTRLAFWKGSVCLLRRLLKCVVPELSHGVSLGAIWFLLPSDVDVASHWLALAMLMAKLFGYPVEWLDKPSVSPVPGVEAQFSILQNEMGEQNVSVSIPEETVSKAQRHIRFILQASQIDPSYLRAFFRTLVETAGLIPVLQPVLATLWSNLDKLTLEDSHSIQGETLASTKGYREALDLGLKWIDFVLRGEGD